MRIQILPFSTTVASIVPFVLGLLSMGSLQAFEMRQWSDASGSFKIQASLINVDNGLATLKSNQGKTVKVPVAKLSKADQAYLAKAASASPFEEVEDSPFEEVEADDVAPTRGPAMTPRPKKSESVAGDETTASSRETSGAGSGGGWAQDLKLDWGDAEVLDTSFVDEWDFDVTRVKTLGSTPKRATLKKLAHPNESLTTFQVNPRTNKAVLGYGAGDRGAGTNFSRVTVIDLADGRAVASDSIEGKYVPLAVLDDGITFVMRANGDWHEDNIEKKNVLQLWRMNGRKVQRTKSWIPLVSDSREFGREKEANIRKVLVVPGNRLVIEFEEGQLGCLDAFSREPQWFTQLSREHSMDLSPDGQLLAVTDMGKVMIVDPVEGVVLASKEIEQTGSINWPAVRWSPSGKKLLFTHGNTFEVLDLATGEWQHQGTFPGHPLAMSGVLYPHEDYMLVGGRALIHLPTMIHACDYHDSGTTEVFGDFVLSASQAANQGIVFGVKLPHPELAKFIEDSGDDPSLFVIHPGVEVSINAGGTGANAADVTAKLTAAAEAAGYRVTSNAPLQIVASISGPRQQKVNYTREGDKTVSVTDSKLAITSNGKEIWAQTANNLPWFVSRREDESFDAKVSEMTSKPNLSIYEKPNFPKKLQKPAPGDGPQRTNALTSVKLMQVASLKANTKSNSGARRPALK